MSLIDNAYVSKVVYCDTVLIDLTSDTVNEAKLLKGVTAHDSTGRQIVGMVEPGYVKPSFSVQNETLVLVPGTGNESNIIFQLT